jgi:wyosine [tRNA(Phe)-imidazoG37] synthetase (radical SAM superfamily)
MDCIYCQLGPSPKKRISRKELVPVREVLAQIRLALGGGQKIDCLTFSGSGEPTLHAGLGRIIAGIKRITGIPVVVLTNGSLLSNAKVRRDLRAADIVVPSLDAVIPSVFAKVNRPHPSLTVKKIIDGLARFRKEYKGQIWLEVMLLKGVNDGQPHLKKLKETIALIRPDKVQLNTVVRPPAENFARALSIEKLEKIKSFLGPTAEIIADFRARDQVRSDRDTGEAILATVKRRPMTAQDISLSLGKPLEEVCAHLVRLVQQRRLKGLRHKGLEYYEPL